MFNQTAANFFHPGCVYLDSQIKAEDDEADHLDALGEAAGGLPGRGAIPGVRGDGQGRRALHECQQQHHHNG